MIIIYSVKNVGSDIIRDHLKKSNIKFIDIKKKKLLDMIELGIKINNAELIKIITIIENPINNYINKFLDSNKINLINMDDEKYDTICSSLEQIQNPLKFNEHLIKFMDFLDIDNLNKINFSKENGYGITNMYFDRFQKKVNMSVLIISLEYIDTLTYQINNFLGTSGEIENTIKKNERWIVEKREIKNRLSDNFINNVANLKITQKFYSNILERSKSILNKDIFFNQFKNEFVDFLKNKRVVIIGPAPYLEGLKKGKIFDEYDVVVRMNRGLGLIQVKEDYGSRCDILYHCMSQDFDNGGNIDIDQLKTHNVKYLRACYPPLTSKDKSSFQTRGTYCDYHSFEHKFKKLSPTKFCFIPKDFYLNHERKMKTRPNSGIIGILDLLNSDLKELYITGFTFFKDGYNKHYRDKIDGITIGSDHGAKLVKRRLTMYGTHDQRKIIEYLKHYLKYEERVKMDEQVKNSMN